MIETGRTPISADRVRSIARAYDCSDDQLVDALAAMAGRRTRGWWEAYREQLAAALVDLAELEHHATGLHVALVIHIPALLQTTDHARALFRAVVPPMRQTAGQSAQESDLSATPSPTSLSAQQFRPTSSSASMIP